MISSQNLGLISPIFLTVVLMIYLIIIELGNPKMRKALFPFAAVLTGIFLIIAFMSIYTTYINLK